MTGRQLIDLAINRHFTPELPIDLGGSITGITRGACAKLCDYLDKSGEWALGDGVASPAHCR